MVPPPYSRASGERKSRFRPQVERLEDRTLLATLTVTSLADSGAGTLRSAIVQANADPSPDTIVFDPALTSAGPATVALSALGDATAGKSALLVTSPITIAGPLADYGITLSMASEMRFFHVGVKGSLTLENLKVTGGRASGGNGGNSTYLGGSGGGGAVLGGAIFNQGLLTINRCLFIDNVAKRGQGGAFGGLGTGNVLGGGGGGYNDGGPGDGGNGGFGGGGAGAGTFSANGGAGGFGGGGSTYETFLGIPLGKSGDAGRPGFGGGGGIGINARPGSGFGGAIFSHNGDARLTNVTVVANSVLTGTGQPAGIVDGSAIYIFSDSARSEFIVRIDNMIGGQQHGIRY